MSNDISGQAQATTAAPSASSNDTAQPITLDESDEYAATLTLHGLGLSALDIPIVSSPIPIDPVSRLKYALNAEHDALAQGQASTRRYNHVLFALTAAVTKPSQTADATYTRHVVEGCRRGLQILESTIDAIFLGLPKPDMKTFSSRRKSGVEHSFKSLTDTQKLRYCKAREILDRIDVRSPGDDHILILGNMLLHVASGEECEYRHDDNTMERLDAVTGDEHETWDAAMRHFSIWALLDMAKCLSAVHAGYEFPLWGQKV